jgi:hypothetical protein
MELIKNFELFLEKKKPSEAQLKARERFKEMIAKKKKKECDDCCGKDDKEDEKED